MLLIFNQKVRRYLLCSRLSLGFQHILYFCGKISFPVELVSKVSWLFLTSKCPFTLFLLDFPIVSSIAVCVSIKDFICASLELSSFFKYSTFSLSKSVLLFWLTSKFFKTWFKVSEKVLSLLSIIEISQLTRLLSADSCASIFQISCSFTVSVGTFWVDCIDGVCIFLSNYIAGWFKISERSNWEFSSPIPIWFNSVI